MKYLVVALLLVASCSYALPLFSDNVPVNNSFYGKGAINFSVNITSSSLNTNSVYMFVISEDAYINQEPWDNYTLACINVTGIWKCTRTVSFAVAGSDTQEFFYFRAEDADGNATYGTNSSPLRFRIDRTGPSVTFLGPSNNSYVSGLVNVSVSTSDAVSGVNQSMTRISIDNGPWNSMSNPYSVNTSQYPNNYSLSIRINATDNVGNPTVSQINVIVDNELPRINISQPAWGEKISGTKILSITVNDSFSGIKPSGVSFVIVGGPVLMNCNGTIFGQVCTYPVDTTVFIDGNFTVIFYVYDNTSNLNTSDVNVTVKNSAPGLALSPEGFVSGAIAVNASITNPEGIITSVSLQVTGPTSLNATMSCNGQFTLCTYSMNTSQFIEGAYTLLANASNILNNAIFDTAAITIDNTKPNLTVNSPSVVKGLATINADVTDDNHDSSKVVLVLLGNQYPMTCLPQGNRLLCYIDFNFSTISDGIYNMTVTATDKANNADSKILALSVDKDPPELAYVVIQPLNPTLSVGVSISVALTDKGSSVKSAVAVIKFESVNYSINLDPEDGLWTQTYYASASGSYEVDISAEDMNGNAKNFSKVGYFFMGKLACGDGVCQDNENYCLCPGDCTAPKCSGSQTLSCSSGIPKCAIFGSCGDKVCGLGETCVSCSNDCGSCSGALQPGSSQSGTTTEGGADVAGAIISIYELVGGNLPVIITVIAIIAMGAIIFVIKKRQKYSL